MSASPRDLANGVARVLLSGVFLIGGLDAARHPAAKIRQAETVVRPLQRVIPFLPADTATAVTFNGLVQVAAGLAMAAGVFARPSALVLAASLVPTTIAGHRFWEQETPDDRLRERLEFLNNAGLLGGLLAVATRPTPGRRS